MAVISGVRFEIPTTISTPQWVADKWAETLKARAQQVNDNRKARIPDDIAFNDKLATPAINGYNPFVNPDFESRSGLNSNAIKARQGGNIKRSYIKYNKQLDYAFSNDAEQFKAAIDRAKDDYSAGLAARSLMFTGTRKEGIGIATLAGLWLVGDSIVVGKLRPGDQVLLGGPYRVVDMPIAPAFKAGLAGKIVQSGCVLTAGEVDPVLLLEANNGLNQLADGLKSATLGIAAFSTGGESHIDFMVIDGQLYLDVQVGVEP